MELFSVIEQFWAQLQNGQVTQLGTLAYFLLLLGVMIEGPVTTMLGAAAAAMGYLQVELVFAIAVLGNLLADTVWYMVGRFFQVEWLQRIAGKHQDKIAILTDGMRQHDRKIIFMAKLSAGLAIASFIAAGMVGIRYLRWIPISLLGELIWSGGLVLVGFFAAQFVWQVNGGMQLLALLTPFVGMVAAVWFVQRKLQAKQLTLSQGGVAGD